MVEDIEASRRYPPLLVKTGPLSRREESLDVLRRFFRDDFGSEARRDLWADDGVFDMPFARNGPTTFKGKQAIYERAKISYAQYESFQFKDIEILSTLDEEVFFVTCRSEYLVNGSGRSQGEHYINKFRVRDGLVRHRVEYFNALTHV
jgi:ketosteroid isomerase-like protein